MVCTETEIGAQSWYPQENSCVPYDVIGAQIFLVGTAHVSRDSAAEVRELIHVVRPSTIMVELCQKRADKLRSSSKVQCSSSSLACVAVPGLLQAAAVHSRTACMRL